MKISFVVAASENNVIGCNNQLLWRLPNDMKFFKNTTWGMPVIMGRKTFLSLGARPLPGRQNIILTRQKDHGIINEEVWITGSVEEALSRAGETDCKEVFVVGGGQIYEIFLPLTQKIFMTRVHTFLEGDTFFPLIKNEEWKKVYHLNFPADDHHAYAYTFETWERN